MYLIKQKMKNNIVKSKSKKHYFYVLNLAVADVPRKCAGCDDR